MYTCIHVCLCTYLDLVTCKCLPPMHHGSPQFHRLRHVYYVLCVIYVYTYNLALCYSIYMSIVIWCLVYKLVNVDRQGVVHYMGVSKNRGTPKWMVYNGKPYQNGWFGGTTILGNPHIVCFHYMMFFLFDSCYFGLSQAQTLGLPPLTPWLSRPFTSALI